MATPTGGLSFACKNESHQWVAFCVQRKKCAIGASFHITTERLSLGSIIYIIMATPTGGLSFACKNESHRWVAFCGAAFNGIIMLMAATQCIDTLLFGQVCDDCHGSAIFQMVGHVVSFLTGGIILLATIGVIIAGIMILTSKDNAQQLAKAKKRLVEVIIGIVVFAGMSLIADFLLPGGVANNSQNSGICPEVANLPPSGTGDPTTDPESSATMTDIIAKTAATMSWPIQSWQEGFDPFFDTSADGSGKVSYGSRSQRSYGGATTIGKCWWQGGSQWITQVKSASKKHLCANTKTGGAVRGRIMISLISCQMVHLRPEMPTLAATASFLPFYIH